MARPSAMLRATASVNSVFDAILKGGLRDGSFATNGVDRLLLDPQASSFLSRDGDFPKSSVPAAPTIERVP